MNIANLRVFLAILEVGNVSVAARKLGISQSGASTALCRLRENLDDELFVKTLRGMEPTPRARSMAAPVRRIVEAADELANVERKFVSSVATDEFRMVAGDVLEATVLTMLATDFEVLAPHARISSISMAESELESALSSGKIDVCLGSFENFGPNVQRSTIARYTFRCFCNRDHPLANHSVSAAEFSNARFAILDSDSSISNPMEDWLRAMRIDRNIVVRCAHFHALTSLIAGTNLLAIVPTGMEGAWLFPGAVAPVHLPFDLPAPRLNIYWHRIFHQDPRNKWFRRLIADGLRQLTRERLARPPHLANQILPAGASLGYQ